MMELMKIISLYCKGLNRRQDFFSFPQALKLNIALFEGKIITGNIHIYSLILLKNTKWNLRQWELIQVTYVPISSGMV